MKVIQKSIFGLLAVGSVIGASPRAFGAPLPVYTDMGDTGSLEIVSNPPAFPPAVATLPNPYSTSAITAPVITALPAGDGWVLTFTLNSNFFASANNHGGGGETTTMAGKLDFQLTFSTPIELTATINEGGIFATAGNGTVTVGGGTVMAEGVDPVTPETITNGNLGAGAVFDPATRGWSSTAQVTGFQHAYTTYVITVDNDLTAESLIGPPLGSAMIAKKEFSIVVTDDGTNGGSGRSVPEPASLGVMAIGAMGLLRRRRV